MKYKKRILTYVLLISLMINCFPTLEVKAVADAFKHADTGRGCLYYTSSSDLPSGDFYFFYKWADGKAWYTTSLKGAIALCNKQGLIFKPDWISVNWSGLAFCNYIIGLGTSIASNLVCASSEYAGGSGWSVQQDLNNIIGVAINDITGCTLSNHGGVGGEFTTDSWINNIVHDYVDNLTDNISPDFISFPTVTDNQFNNFTPYDSSYSSIYSSILNDFQSVKSVIINNNDMVNITDQGYITGMHYFVTYGVPFNQIVFSYPSHFSDLVSQYSLTQLKNVINLNDVLTSKFNYDISCNVFDSSSLSALTYNATAYSYNTSSYSIDEEFTDNRIGLYRDSGQGLNFICSDLGWVTIYSDISIPESIADNTYQPSVLSSNTWNNYNSSLETNSTVLNTTNIQYSTTNNSEIYNTTNTEINNNTSNNSYNYNYDNSSTVINNIVNNYYGSSGGDSGSDPDPDDDSIWDKLLEALGGLFDKLGDIIVVVATGIISIFTTILNLIVEISTNFTTITDTLSAFFSWIPTEIMTPIILGVNLMILIILLNAIKR